LYEVAQVQQAPLSWPNFALIIDRCSKKKSPNNLTLCVGRNCKICDSKFMHPLFAEIISTRELVSTNDPMFSQLVPKYAKMWRISQRYPMGFNNDYSHVVNQRAGHHQSCHNAVRSSLTSPTRHTCISNHQDGEQVKQPWTPPSTLVVTFSMASIRLRSPERRWRTR
jgi:hypothetical protein